MISKWTRLRWWWYGLVDKIPTGALTALGFCPYCLQHSVTVCKRPTRTAYVEEARNCEVSCADCYEEHDAEWKARWAEYYAGCL